MKAQRMLFVNQYMIHRNAKRAAIEAGYKPSTAREQGCVLLKQPEIKAEIQRRLDADRHRNEISIDRLISEEKCLAFSNAAGVYDSEGTPIPINQLPESLARAVSSVDITEKVDSQGNKVTTFKYRFWDKGKALERLGRYLGMYNDSINISFDQGIVMVLEVLPEEIRDQVIDKVRLANCKPSKTLRINMKK